MVQPTLNYLFNLNCCVLPLSVYMFVYMFVCGMQPSLDATYSQLNLHFLHRISLTFISAVCTQKELIYVHLKPNLDEV